MPVYFSEVAATCPVARDQPVGPMSAPTIRTNIPRAHDLASAIAAVNLLRSIINQIVVDKVINNVFTPPPLKPRTQLADSVIDRLRHTRWSEQKAKRIKRRYKYYAEDENGNEDRDVWVMTERIERMVWYDAAWKTSLVFSYGDKGEGEPQGGTPAE